MIKGNYKIDVSALSTAERTALQEELFKQGYWWNDDTRHVINLDEEYLCLFEDRAITYCDKDYFARSLFTPITVSDIMPQPEERTLRDWFAGLALQGILNDINLSIDEKIAPIYAKQSYIMADAMIKERNK